MSGMDGDERRGLLARAPLFSGLSDRELGDLARVTRAKRLRPREELFHKGDEGSCVYVVASGALKVLTTSDEGDDVVFHIMGPGELIGEMAFLAHTPRTATVAALSEAAVLVIDWRDFFAFLHSHPDASIKLLSVLAERLKNVSELVEDTLFLNLPVRLAKKLVYYAGIYGEPAQGGGVRISLRLSQEEWGDLVGATRESINKQLRAWSEQGIVRSEKGFLVIRRQESLERLAGCAVS